MIKIKYFLFLLLQCNTFSTFAKISPHTITFFIRPLPISFSISDTRQFEKNISSPEKMVKSLIRKELNPLHLNSGIYATYAGNFAVSDMNGEIVFPRVTSEPILSFLVIEDVKAVPLDPKKNKTLTGFLPDPNAPFQFYRFERIQDPETELFSWVVTEESYNKNKRIPLNTIVIFANPKHIIATLGTTNTVDSENLILPDIFSTHNLNSALNALRFFKVRHYFEPVQMEYNSIPDGYQQKINEKG